jgi:hypothetical protein
MQYKDSLYRGNKGNAQHKGRKNPKQGAKQWRKGRLCRSGYTRRHREHQAAAPTPKTPGDAKHDLKRRSVAFTHNQRAKTPWRVRTTRRAPVKHATKTSGGRGGKRRGTRLNGACQAEIDGCA